MQATFLKEKLLAELAKSKCGLFATKTDCNEAMEYAVSLIKASGPSNSEKEYSCAVAFGVYHNTLVQNIIDSIKEEPTVHATEHLDVDSLVVGDKLVVIRSLTNAYYSVGTAYEVLEIPSEDNADFFISDNTSTRCRFGADALKDGRDVTFKKVAKND